MEMPLKKGIPIHLYEGGLGKRGPSPLTHTHLIRRYLGQFTDDSAGTAFVFRPTAGIPAAVLEAGQTHSHQLRPALIGDVHGVLVLLNNLFLNIEGTDGVVYKVLQAVARPALLRPFSRASWSVLAIACKQDS